MIQELTDCCEEIQDDLICVLDAIRMPPDEKNKIITNACQVIVAKFHELEERLK